jgi:peptidyl-prolyl cis-trans isomerase A (cyclophilin A)
MADRDKERPERTQPPKSRALLEPSLAGDRAPERFRVRFETTKGDFVIEAIRDWSPQGVDRFFNLVKIGYFEDVAFFRVLDGFVVQFGISGDPAVNERWRSANIPDEPVKESNTRGRITYAKGGPNSRTTQLFINLADNANLDAVGFPPFGQVVEGMSVVESLYSGYGEGAPRGRGPSQGRIHSDGNRYLRESFPQLDYIEKTVLLGS